jgi:hypothetical protein
MMAGAELGAFLMVVFRLEMMGMGQVSVMMGLFMMARLMRLGSLFVVVSSLFVMLSG